MKQFFCDDGTAECIIVMVVIGIYIHVIKSHKSSTYSNKFM